MAYTGVLEKDATAEQILTAKKTVQIITEINGQKYINTLDGTKGLIVAVNDGARTSASVMASSGLLVNMLDAILSEIPRELLFVLLSSRLSEISGPRQPI